MFVRGTRSGKARIVRAFEFRTTSTTARIESRNEDGRLRRWGAVRGRFRSSSRFNFQVLARAVTFSARTERLKSDNFHRSSARESPKLASNIEANDSKRETLVARVHGVVNSLVYRGALLSSKNHFSGNGTLVMHGSLIVERAPEALIFSDESYAVQMDARRHHL